MQDDDKRIAAHAAVAEVREGMIVGLGTGSTAAFAIARLGELAAEGLAIRGVATSIRTARAARAAGIVLLDPGHVAAIDIAIDGADEIDARLFAIKGAGGAMLREKIVAAMARRMIVVADASKQTAVIGRAPVPVEIAPFARAAAVAAVERMGARVVLRMAGNRPARSDQGNVIADCHFASLPDPRATAAALSMIPGLLGHGLFVDEVDAAYIARDGAVNRIERP